MKFNKMKMIVTATILSLALTACSMNEHESKAKIAQYNALKEVNMALNKPNLVECEAKCKIEIARENRVMYTAQMMQEFSSIDRLIAGGVSITEIVAKGLFNPATLQAYAMYKGLEVVSENGGTHIVNTDSYNSHSEEYADVNNDKSQVLTDVDNDKSSINQSDFNNNKSSIDSHDNNSQTDLNNDKSVKDDNSSTEVKEPVIDAPVDNPE